MPVVIDGVTRCYGGGARRQCVLDAVSAVFEPGRAVAIVGRSGSGKSTLLNLIGGLDEPDAGSIRIGTQVMSGLDDDGRTRFRRRHIGFVFQFFNLLPTLSVAENVRLPLELLDGDADHDARVHDALRAVGLERLAARFPEELSGGEQQRTAIARALIHRPAIVLADEPTGNLDLATARDVVALLDALCRDAGTTLVMATHSPEVVGYADEIWEVRDAALRRLNDAP